MKWIKDIMEKHTDDNGVLNREAAENEINAEANKHVIPKEQYNNKVNELKQANETLDTLKNEHKDVEALQTTLSQHEETIEELQKQNADQAKKYQLEIALKDAGGKDLDYLQFKLGDVELDDDGNIKDLDNKLKSLKEDHPSFFEGDDDEKNSTNKNGFRVQDNKLDKGNPAPKLTKEDISKIEDPDKRLEAIQQNISLYS